MYQVERKNEPFSPPWVKVSPSQCSGLSRNLQSGVSREYQYDVVKIILWHFGYDIDVFSGNILLLCSPFIAMIIAMIST